MHGASECAPRWCSSQATGVQRARMEHPSGCDKLPSSLLGVQPRCQAFSTSTAGTPTCAPSQRQSTRSLGLSKLGNVADAFSIVCSLPMPPIVCESTSCSARLCTVRREKWVDPHSTPGASALAMSTWDAAPESIPYFDLCAVGSLPTVRWTFHKHLSFYASLAIHGARQISDAVDEIGRNFSRTIAVAVRLSHGVFSIFLRGGSNRQSRRERQSAPPRPKTRERQTNPAFLSRICCTR